MSSSNHAGALVSLWMPKPVCSFDCHMPISEPVESAATTITPRSPTGWGPAKTWPPCSFSVATLASASATSRYTDHMSGSDSSIFPMSPATITPSLVKLA